MNKKKISIIMLAYNVEQYISEAITCILNQTFIDWQLIIINDGSTDNTQDHIDQFNDPRLKVIEFPINRGAGWASNYALKLVDTPYVARMDADDLCHPTRFQKQYDFINNNSHVDVVRCYAEYFSDDPLVINSEFYKQKKGYGEPLANQKLTSKEISEVMYWYQCMVSPAALMKTSAVKHIDYPMDYRLGEDYYLLYNLNKQNYIFDTIPEYLYQYRVSEGTSTHIHKDSHAKVHYQIKKHEIKKLFESNNVYIWGTGSQAKRLRDFLSNDGYKIKGHIDYNQNTDLYPTYKPEKLEPRNDKVIVAATPVRDKIVVELKSRGFKHLEDFVVFR